MFRMVDWIFPNKKRSRRVIFAMFVGKSQKENLDDCVRKYESCGHFDEVRAYTFDMLPESIQKMDFPDYTPYMILDIMKDMGDNDILVYADPTNVCELENNWTKWLKIISGNSALFFFYGETMGSMSEIMMRDSYYRNKIYPALQLNCDFYLLKKSVRKLIEEWRDNLKSVDSEVSSRMILSYVIYNHLDDDKIKIFIQN